MCIYAVKDGAREPIIKTWEWPYITVKQLYYQTFSIKQDSCILWISLYLRFKIFSEQNIGRLDISVDNSSLTPLMKITETTGNA